eukprot:1156499-Pelagomonas_calceolata.AAC.12
MQLSTDWQAAVSGKLQLLICRALLLTLPAGASRPHILAPRAGGTICKALFLTLPAGAPRPHVLAPRAGVGCCSPCRRGV